LLQQKGKGQSMKAIFLGAVALGITVLAGQAQQTNQVQLAQPPGETPNKPPITVTAPPQPATLQRVFGPTATTGGVVPALRRRELFKRPLLPPGQAFENVAVNPHSGRAEGIFLFSIKF
jgi:hypothetical protein